MFESVRVGSRGSASVLVLGHFAGEKLDRASARRDVDGSVREALARGEATGEVGSIAEAFPRRGGFERVIVVGLGDRETFTAASGPARLRSAAAAVGRRLAAVKSGNIEVDISGPISAGRGKTGKVEPAVAGRAFAESMGILGWTYDTLRGSGTTKKNRVAVNLRSADDAFTAGMRTGLALAEACNEARRLSQTPPNVATPMWIAGECKKLARETGLACTVFSGKRLEEERFAGLINVGKASENEPCMIRLAYTPARAKRGVKPVVLIGKTMTYDSGGLSLKVNNGMKGMKRDKDGGCAVIGAMRAIATLVKPEVPVVALLVAAENSVSDEAYRPDDVITFRNGVTVEVTNTDAEGRLVLADALCWAFEKEKPAAVVDVATLTGGVVVALGNVFAGMFCDDDGLRGALESAGEATGERVWRLPHDAKYREMMKSPIADIVNSAPVREAHPIQGAAFLSSFCEAGVPWAHLDIAGVHATERDSGPFIAGPTGWGARLLAELLARYPG